MTKVSTSPENSAESLAVRAAMRRERLAARVALARSTELHASMSAAIQQSLSNGLPNKARQVLVFVRLYAENLTVSRWRRN